MAERKHTLQILQTFVYRFFRFSSTLVLHKFTYLLTKIVSAFITDLTTFLIINRKKIIYTMYELVKILFEI